MERKAMLLKSVLLGAVLAALIAADAADAQTQRRTTGRSSAAGAKPAAKVTPPAPAAVAPAPVDSGTPPQPIGSVADWFPADAYPPQARAAGQEGRTAFALDIDALGRITQCRVLQSSGSDLLDSATCTQAIINGRFRPARDAAGKPVARAWQSSMRWQLAERATDE
ncbi:MAG: hypothetical protein C0476_12560 [Sphingomonas sp.]|nr:hypothetical protein [Sphingomonas sp.]